MTVINFSSKLKVNHVSSYINQLHNESTVLSLTLPSTNIFTSFPISINWVPPTNSYFIFILPCFLPKDVLLLLLLPWEGGKSKWTQYFKEFQIPKMCLLSQRNPIITKYGKKISLIHGIITIHLYPKCIAHANHWLNIKWKEKCIQYRYLKIDH